MEAAAAGDAAGLSRYHERNGSRPARITRVCSAVCSKRNAPGAQKPFSWVDKNGGRTCRPGKPNDGWLPARGRG